MFVLTVPLLVLVLGARTGLLFGEGGVMYDEGAFSDMMVGVREAYWSVSAMVKGASFGGQW